MIRVTTHGGSAFSVEAGGRSFAVTAGEALTASLGAPDAASLVRASFEFLLEREPATSILPRFDLEVIERYFPGWRRAMRERFS